MGHLPVSFRTKTGRALLAAMGQQVHLGSCEATGVLLRWLCTSEQQWPKKV